MSLAEQQDGENPVTVVRLTGPPPLHFGLRLRAIRQAFNKEQKEMAEWLGIKLSSYSAYEKGPSQPRARDIVDVAKRIQEITGCPATWLLGLEPEVQLRTGRRLRALTCIDGSGESSSRLPKPSLVVVQ